MLHLLGELSSKHHSKNNYRKSSSCGEGEGRLSANAERDDSVCVLMEQWTEPENAWDRVWTASLLLSWGLVTTGIGGRVALYAYNNPPTGPENLRAVRAAALGMWTGACAFVLYPAAVVLLAVVLGKIANILAAQEVEEKEQW